MRIEKWVDMTVEFVVYNKKGKENQVFIAFQLLKRERLFRKRGLVRGRCEVHPGYGGKCLSAGD